MIALKKFKNIQSFLIATIDLDSSDYVILESLED
jgi:hypothetical protein